MTSQSRRTFLRAVGVAGGTAAGMGSASASVSRQQDPVGIRAVHAAPDAPAVDVIVNDEPLVEDATFPTVGGYFEGRSDAFEIRVVPAGGGEPIVEATRSFDPGTVQTLALAGTGADVHLERFVDRLERPAAGEARWRFVNLVPDAPGVDVVVPNRQRFFRGVEFGEQSRYRDVAAGTHRVVLRRGGTDRRLVAFDRVPLAADTVYSAFAVGFLDGDPTASLLLAEDRSFEG